MEKTLEKETKLRESAINQVLIDKKTSKSRSQIYHENYQKNKERKKQQRQQRYQQDKEAEKAKQKQRYLKKKEQVKLLSQQQSSKHYGAEAIKILMSLKKYTELNQEKKRIWLDFCWTLEDFNKSIKEGINDITGIMKLEQVVGNLIKDYWVTAKSEIKEGKSWNSLSEEKQEKLIRYWGYQKARQEQNYLTEEEKLVQESQEYYKEIELAKFHEERGKKGCSCYDCSEKKKIRVKLSKQMMNNDYPKKMFCPKCQTGNTKEFRIRIRCGSKNMKKMCANSSCKNSLKD